MSGGSLNYLYRQHHPNRTDLLEAWWQLTQHGCTHAAEETLEFLHHRTTHYTEDENLNETTPEPPHINMPALREMWHAIEWKLSGDWGHENLTEAHTKYLDSHPRMPRRSPSTGLIALTITVCWLAMSVLIFYLLQHI